MISNVIKNNIRVFITTTNRENIIGLLRQPHFWGVVFVYCLVLGIFMSNSLYLIIWTTFVNAMVPSSFIHDLQLILFIIPVVYASYIFKIRGALIALLVLLVFVLPQPPFFPSESYSFIKNVVFVIAFIAAGVFIALQREIREKDTIIRTQLEATCQVYLSQLIRAQEEERHRIAQELHDDTIQSLVVIGSMAQSLIDENDTQDNNKRIMVDIRDSIKRVTEDISRISKRLRPSILDMMGLVAAVRWLATQVQKSSGVKVEVNIRGDERRMNAESEVMVFRIIQEALNNIRKHSKASLANIVMQFAAHKLIVEISDNGSGFDLTDYGGGVNVGKLGLAGMQHRANLLAGNLEISSEPGKGSRIRLETGTE
ncbi:MAG TPA: hypothetical protein DCY35_11490 [Prolixibacteraceae bacterium]|nr:hypothetical protein [Prolixibacteraceae bacterium]